jgi:putative hydrolase of the HAD superfamily
VSARAWLVDLDGTLYAPRPLKLLMAAELLLLGPGSLRAVRAFRAEHERLRELELADPRGPFRLQLERAASGLGIAPEALEETVREWMVERPARWLGPLRNRPLIEAIAAHRERGGRAALVSDYPARRKLAALGAAELFEVVVASGEEGGPPRLKPCPDGYLAAARALGVDPAECLVLGDRPDADGEAARRAGMAFHRVRPGRAGVPVAWTPERG